MSPLAAPMPPALPGSSHDLIKHVGLDSFMVDVIEASRAQPVIVDFWSPRSAPCKAMIAILEKLIAAHKGALRLAKVDIDQNPEIVQQMGVQSIPAVFAFFQGRPIDGLMGVQSEAQLKSWFDRIIKATGAVSEEGMNIDSALKQANAFLDAKDIGEAQSIFAEVMAIDPANAPAFAGLLRCLMAMGDNARAQDMLDKAPKDIAADKAMDGVRAALELIAQTAALGPIDDLKAKVEHNPADHQSRFDLAMACYAAGDRESAVDALLEIIKRQRSWNEEAARKQLVKFFEAFGPTDPLTISARRRLSSILFA